MRRKQHRPTGLPQGVRDYRVVDSVGTSKSARCQLEVLGSLSHHSAASMRNQLIIVGAAPLTTDGLRQRLDDNQPELRRLLIVRKLQATADAAVESAGTDADAVLPVCVELGLLSAEKLAFLQTAHAEWRAAPSPEPNFASPETMERDGLVPNFFVRSRPRPAGASWARRLAWHATDIYSPIYADTMAAIADDAAVVVRAVEALLAPGREAVWALTTHPGHHACAEHFGGFEQLTFPYRSISARLTSDGGHFPRRYCFLNHAVLAFRLLRRAGRRPFLVDVDYHAGDGTATFLSPTEFVSIHAPDDYPYVPADAPYAIAAPPGCPWAQYEPLLRAAVARRPADCDILVISLGFDTLDGDPCAAPGHRLTLRPAEFAQMRSALDETGLPLFVAQEGGYHMDCISKAAAAFWR